MTETPRRAAQNFPLTPRGIMSESALYRTKNLRPDSNGRIVRVIVPNNIGPDHPNLELVDGETASDTEKALVRARHNFLNGS